LSLSLKQRLIRDMTHSGPLSVPSYMQICLFDPKGGYYSQNVDFDRDGDFLTAPRLSHVFGEMIGLWFYPLIVESLKKGPISLVEIGGGDGQLLRDLATLYRAILPECPHHIDYVYVEASERLLSHQLSHFSAATGISNLKSLKTDQPIFILGNEVFDCFGANQYVSTPKGQFERVVGIDPDQPDQLKFGLIPAIGITPPPNWPEGVIFEHSASQICFWSEILDLVALSQGSALFVDYGHDVGQFSFGDTLQAIKSHQKKDPLGNPGLDDLTQWVDFTTLDAMTRKVPHLVGQTVHQGSFLRQMGIEARLSALGRKYPDRQAQYERLLSRLCDQKQMGHLFKLITATHQSLVEFAAIVKS